MTVSRFTRLRGAAVLAALAGCLGVPAAYADSGFYIGGSLGDANVEVKDIGFDENDSAGKVFGGYIVDMPVVDFGVEVAYVKFGNPSGASLLGPLEVDLNGISGFGMVGIDYGLFGIFAKAGVVSWDDDISSESGSDSAYGLGFRLTFSSVEVRAEYERFDIADIDAVDMLSLGVLWRF
jgi:outer membrane immunogenic protein